MTLVEEVEHWKTRALAAEALINGRRERQRERMRSVRARGRGCARTQKQAVLPITLGTRLEQPRYDFSIVEQQTSVPPGRGPLVLELLVTMNRTLGQLYDDYKPVRGDNYASRAVAEDFESVGMDPAWAAAELRSQCVKFNRGKHGKGNLPGTLAYFRRGLLGAWSRYRDGGQLELSLISLEAPKMAPVPQCAALVTKSRSVPEPVVNEKTYNGGCDWRSLVPKPERTVRVA